jgi:hypothetical protein
LFIRFFISDVTRSKNSYFHLFPFYQTNRGRLISHSDNSERVSLRFFSTLEQNRIQRASGLLKVSTGEASRRQPMEDREENCLPQELFWASVKFRAGPSIAKSQDPSSRVVYLDERASTSPVLSLCYGGNFCALSLGS